MSSPVLIVPSDEESRWRFAAARLDRFEARPITPLGRRLAQLLLVVVALGLLVLLIGAIAGLSGHAVWPPRIGAHGSVAAFAPVVAVVGALVIRAVVLNRSFPWGSTLGIVGETMGQRRAIRSRIARCDEPAERDHAAVARGIACEERNDEAIRSSFFIGFGLALVPHLRDAGPWDVFAIAAFLVLASMFTIVAVRRIIRASRYLRRHPVDPVAAIDAPA